MDFLAEVLKPIPMVVWGGPPRALRGEVVLLRKCYAFTVQKSVLCVVRMGLLSPGYDNVKRILEKPFSECDDGDNSSICFAFPSGIVHITKELITLILPSFVGFV